MKHQEVGRIIFDKNGNATALYTEIIDLHKLGKLKISRASYVEPDKNGDWWADLSPVNGPKIGPYKTRTIALAAEVRWLKEHILK